MTTNHALLSTVLTVALTLPLFGPHNHGDMSRTDKKKHDMSSMMGKPTVDVSVNVGGVSKTKEFQYAVK